MLVVLYFQIENHYNKIMRNKRKTKLGYIKEEMLNYYNTGNDFGIDENNVIDIEDINNNFEYNENQQTQNNIINNEEEFDYTFLKIIVFLIFV